jgi:hypothetical protein
VLAAALLRGESVRIGSREYQARLQPDRFVPGETDLGGFLRFLGRLDPAVRIDDREAEAIWFTRELWDTPHRQFHAQGYKLRTRAHAGFVACTFKAIGLDRYTIANAPVHSGDETAKEKFEEGIYAFHASFSKQTTTKQPLPLRLIAVKDWARMFPGALEIASWHDPLYCVGRARVERVRGLRLDFAGTTVNGMLEIHYSPSADVPEKVEFSWKHRSKRERYAPEVARSMRSFLQALNHSDWGDTSAHLKKALADGAGHGRSPLGAETGREPAADESPSQMVRRILTKPLRDPVE